MDAVVLICSIQALGLSAVTLTMGLGFHFLASGNGGIPYPAHSDWLEKIGLPGTLTCFLP